MTKRAYASQASVRARVSSSRQYQSAKTVCKYLSYTEIFGRESLRSNQGPMLYGHRMMKYGDITLHLRCMNALLYLTKRSKNKSHAFCDLPRFPKISRHIGHVVPAFAGVHSVPWGCQWLRPSQI